MGNDPYIGIPIPEVNSDQSFIISRYSLELCLHHQVLCNITANGRRNTHFENIIVEPKNLQRTINQACLRLKLCKRNFHNFTRLSVGKLFPPPDKAFFSPLKWIYKVKNNLIEILGVSPEEPIRKSKRVKRLAKKSTNAPTTGVVIRDTPVMSLSKKKEKMTVEKHKGIDLLSEVALTKEAQYEEVCKKSLRDFHKTHPSGSGIVTSAAKIKPSITNEGTDDSNNDHDSSSEGNDQESDSGDDNTQSDKEKRSNSEHETDENETGSKSDQEKNEEEVEDDEEEKDNEFVKTPSNYTDDKDETNDESKVEDNAEGDEDKGMGYTTNQFDDDVDVRLNEPVNTGEGLIQKEGTNAEMINIQQGNENLEITLNQVIEDDHVKISTVTKKTEVPVTSSSHSSDLASKFLNFLDIPHTDAETVSLMDVHVHHEILPKEVSNFALPLIKSMVTESLEHAVLAKESSQPQSTYEAAASLTKFELKKLIKSYELDKSLFSTYDKVYLLKRSRKDKDKDEDPSAGSDRGLKKRKTSKDAEPTKAPKIKESKSGSSKGTKSQSKSFGKSVHEEEPEFVVADSDMPQDQEENLGNDDEEPKRKVASKHGWFTKPKQPEEPTNPDWNVGKTPQQGPTQSWLMTLASSADKPSKTFDELMSTTIDFSAYIMNGLKITNLTQETLLGLAFKLLKGTRTNFAELEYDFEECYKALSEKLD
ncbi:hypothetical protein Tco_1575077 [Tanacetum coccineum]